MISQETADKIAAMRRELAEIKERVENTHDKAMVRYDTIAADIKAIDQKTADNNAWRML